MCAGHTSHAFLINPASQNTYLYLTAYIKNLSEAWLGRPFQQVEILDWGSGKGHMSYLLKTAGARVASCDVSTDASDSSFGQNTPIISHQGIHVTPLNHDFLLPYADSSFDAVISMGVLEHVPREKESLKELHRVLRPGGLFFCFYLPQRFSWTQKIQHIRGDHYHDRLYDKAIVTSLLHEAAFTPIDIWQRALFPKNTVNYRDYQKAEAWDQFLTEKTPFRHLATNIECVAYKAPS